MPCGDVPGRVRVSIAGVSAGHAAEQGLALAAARCDMPARRAPLARVRGTYFLHPAGGLVGQAADQQAPPGSHDLAVEAGLRCDVPAWLLLGALRRAGHVPDLEILDPDQVEPPGDIRRRLLAPVLADVRAAGLEPGGCVPDPPAALRAAHSPGQLPLQPPQPPLLRCGQAGAVQQLPVDRAALTATPRSMPTAAPVPGP